MNYTAFSSIKRIKWIYHQLTHKYVSKVLWKEGKIILPKFRTQYKTCACAFRADMTMYYKSIQTYYLVNSYAVCLQVLILTHKLCITQHHSKKLLRGHFSEFLISDRKELTSLKCKKVCTAECCLLVRLV